MGLEGPLYTDTFNMHDIVFLCYYFKHVLNVELVYSCGPGMTYLLWTPHLDGHNAKKYRRRVQNLNSD